MLNIYLQNIQTIIGYMLINGFDCIPHSGILFTKISFIQDFSPF